MSRSGIVRGCLEAPKKTRTASKTAVAYEYRFAEYENEYD